jgi:hypothetical protein
LVEIPEPAPLNIQEVYAVGIGSSVGQDQLRQVAWSSTTGQNNVILADDPIDLSDVLEETVEVQSGNVITDVGPGGTDAPGLDGWGTPRMVSVEYGGETKTFPTGGTGITEFEFTTNAGKLVIRSDGSYDFTPLADVKDDETAVVKYTVRDGDGSEASANLHLTTTDASEVVAVDDTNVVSTPHWDVTGTKTIYVDGEVLTKSGVDWTVVDNDSHVIGVGPEFTDEAYRDYSFSVANASLAVPAELQFQIEWSQYDNASDYWNAEVFRSDGTSAGISLRGYNATGDSYYNLKIPDAGDYYVRFSAHYSGLPDNSSNAVRWWIDNVQVKTPIVQTVKIL